MYHCQKSRDFGCHHWLTFECDCTESPKYYEWPQAAVAHGLDLPTRRLAGRQTVAASKHSLCYFSLFSEWTVTRITLHLQSGNISIYWLWLLLDVSAVSVVIVIIAICDMTRQNSHCVNVCTFTIHTIWKSECRVLKHDANFESSFQEDLCLIPAQLGDRLKD